MTKEQTDILLKLNTIRVYSEEAIKSFANKDSISPQGSLYMIIETSNEVIRELKKISPDL